MPHPCRGSESITEEGVDEPELGTAGVLSPVGDRAAALVNSLWLRGQG